MIAEEDIKVGTVVRHLGNPSTWQDTDAEHFKLFTIVEDIGSLEKYFTENLVRKGAVKANKELFELGTEFSLQALEHSDSIARPILEERKVGKVKMQLFDEAFPNAVMEIARMMSWAEEIKGYKPNDFKNLPNADVEFPAAASRHRVKGFIQKATGIAPIDRVDDESGIVHLAHAAFNIMAELELVLTGKIK